MLNLSVENPIPITEHAQNKAVSPPHAYENLPKYSLVPRHQIFRAHALRPCRKIGSGHVHW